MKTEFLNKRLERLEQLNLLIELDFEERRELTEIKRIKQLIIDSVSISALIVKAEQMQKENEFMLTAANEEDTLNYYKGVGIGISRIIKLIKRH